MAGISLNTNLPSLQTNRRLGDTTARLQKSFERLASGLRINRSADDAAGLSISESLATDSRVYTQAVRNINDGVSITNIADSTLAELTNIVTRLEELAQQSANGTLGPKQRASLDAEAQALSKEYFRISRVAAFNGLNLFTGANPTLRFQAGYGANGGLSGTIGGAVGTASFSAAVKSSLPGNGDLSMTTGDLNGDGILDLVVSGYDLFVKLGLGDGTFSSAVSYLTFESDCEDVSLGDLNGDGILDVVTAGYLGVTGKATIRFGNGNGTFGAAISITTESSISNAVALGDLNNDGLLDLVTAGVGTGGRITVRLGTGSGSFSPSMSYAVTTGTCNALELADLNRDGILDVVASGWSGSNVAVVRLGNGDGSFAAMSTYTCQTASSLALSDLNGDGITDIITSGYDWTDSLGRATILLGNANGSFGTATSYIMDLGDTKDVGTGDLNGDGFQDLVSAGYDDIGNGTFTVRLGNGNGIFAAATSVVSLSGGITKALAIADMNGDGVFDLVGASYDGASWASVNLQSTTPGISPILPFSLRTKADALQALPLMKQALNRVSSQRGIVGALQSRLAAALSTLQAARENFDSARAMITDVDVAQESASLVRNRILQQASSSILSQANQAPALALLLLR